MGTGVNGLGSLEQNSLDFPNADRGYICPTCGSFCKRYFRNLNSNMALTMVVLFNRKKFGFIHIENFLRQHELPRSGDFPYLIHWGLMQKMEGKRPDGSSRNGFYKLTDKGRQFVKGEITVKKTLIIYKNKAEGFEGPETDIKEALGTRFDYNQLMNGDFTMQKV